MGFYKNITAYFLSVFVAFLSAQEPLQDSDLNTTGTAAETAESEPEFDTADAVTVTGQKEPEFDTADVVTVTGQKESETTAEGVEAPKKLIFLYFYNGTGDPQYEWIEVSIGGNIHDTIKNKYRYEKIPEKEWKGYIKQHNYKKEDLYDKKKVARMGLDLGADGVIYGKFEIQNNQIVITGHILSVIDEKIVGTKEEVNPLDTTIFDAVESVSDSLAIKIKDLFYPSNRGALWRSSLLPGWGQFYKQRSDWGYGFAGAFAVSVLYSGYSIYSYNRAVSAYEDYTPAHVVTPGGEIALYDPEAAEEKFDELNADIDSARTQAVISLYIVAGVYVLNLAHAYFWPPPEGNVELAFLVTADQQSYAFATPLSFRPDRLSYQAAVSLRF